jgi:hypothetical protein
MFLHKTVLAQDLAQEMRHEKSLFDCVRIMRGGFRRWRGARAGAGQDHEGMRRRMGQDEGGETDRRHEIPRFQQTVHGGHCRRTISTDCSAGDRCASAGRDARARNYDGEAGDGLGGPPGHDRPRARLRRGVEGRQGGWENPGRNEMAAILERLR